MAKRRTKQLRRPAAPSPSAAPQLEARLRYVESSALVAAMLEQDASAIAALRAPGRLVISALTVAEGSRAIVRARVTGRLTAAQERAAVKGLTTFAGGCFVVGVSSEVLARAGRRFPVEPVRTLDAVHLATLEWLGEPPALVTVVTRDVRIRDNALALGYVVD